MSWRNELRKVTHPPAFAALAIDLGPIRITIGGSERDLVGASFRDVSFFVESSEREGGRRTVKHEFPLRDDPFIDDLGRKARGYKVSGYVLGPAYLEQRDKLIAALEDTAGPGKLIHPYYGEKQCIANTFTVAEKRDEGGLAHFSIHFEETPVAPPFPAVKFSLPSLLGAILGAIAAAIALLAALALAVALTFLAIRALVRNVVAFVDFLKSIAYLFAGNDRALFLLRLDRISDDADALVRRPTDLCEALVEALDFTGANPRDAMGAMLEAYDYDPGDEPTGRAASRVAELDLHRAMTTTFRRIALLKAAQAASSIEWESQQEAAAARTQILDLLDDQAETADENVYHALQQVRTEIARFIPPQTGALPQIVKHTPLMTGPSLVLAYRLYGSVELEVDVVARNRIRHPGFVAGDTELEVLSRG